MVHTTSSPKDEIYPQSEIVFARSIVLVPNLKFSFQLKRIRQRLQWIFHVCYNVSIEIYTNRFSAYLCIGANEGVDMCSWILIGFSYILMIVTLPFSLCLCIRVCSRFVEISVCNIFCFFHLGCSRIRTSCYSSSRSDFTRWC